MHLDLFIPDVNSSGRTSIEAAVLDPEIHLEEESHTHSFPSLHYLSEGVTEELNCLFETYASMSGTPVQNVSWETLAQPDADGSRDKNEEITGEDFFVPVDFFQMGT